MGDDVADPTPCLISCARVDSKLIDRDVQMRYDIAKNEEGPLRRTVKSHTQADARKDTNKGKQRVADLEEEEGCLTARHPGLDGRLADLETHLSIRYGIRRPVASQRMAHSSPIVVPSPPRTLLARLKCLEDHIVRLEKDYPPWAALHFNQPNRGVRGFTSYPVFRS